jgi:hypothetical protein
MAGGKRSVIMVKLIVFNALFSPQAKQFISVIFFFLIG